MQRRALVLGFAGLVLALSSCTATSSLRTLGSPKGSGPIDFQIENQTDSAINNLYVARTSAVQAAPKEAFDSGSRQQVALWGEDQLIGAGLEPKGRMPIRIAEAGRYDVRVVDRDGREQHVAGLQLQAGGRYVLELQDGSWRRPR